MGGGRHLIKDISFPFFNLSLAGIPLKGDWELVIFFFLKKKHFLLLKRKKDAHFPQFTQCTECFPLGIHPINWSDSWNLIQGINNSSKRSHSVLFFEDLSPLPKYNAPPLPLSFFLLVPYNPRSGLDVTASELRTVICGLPLSPPCQEWHFSPVLIALLQLGYQPGPVSDLLIADVSGVSEQAGRGQGSEGPSSRAPNGADA